MRYSVCLSNNPNAVAQGFPTLVTRDELLHNYHTWRRWSTDVCMNAESKESSCSSLTCLSSSLRQAQQKNLHGNHDQQQHGNLHFLPETGFATELVTCISPHLGPLPCVPLPFPSGSETWNNPTSRLKWRMLFNLDLKPKQSNIHTKVTDVV